jgi:hypothetical protein
LSQTEQSVPYRTIYPADSFQLKLKFKHLRLMANEPEYLAMAREMSIEETHIADRVHLKR